MIAFSGDVRAECELIAISFEPVTEVEPESLIFDPFHVKVAPTKAKNLLLRGPLEYVGEIVQIQSSIGGLDVPNQVRLNSSKSGRSAEVQIRALAGIDEGEAIVTAKLDEKVTNCSVTIVESARNKNPKVRMEISGQDNPPRRVDTVPEDGQLVIRILESIGQFQKCLVELPKMDLSMKTHLLRKQVLAKSLLCSFLSMP